MECVYNTALLPYSSGTICLKEFFEKAQSTIRAFVQDKWTAVVPGAAVKTTEGFMLPLLGDDFDITNFRKVQAACRSDKLEVPGQPRPLNISITKQRRVFDKVDIPEDVELKTLKVRASRQGSSLQYLRYTPSIWLDHVISNTWDVDANKVDLVPGQSLIVVIKVYHPFKHKLGEAMSRVPVPAQEIAVLGSNYLSDLRDKITCMSDNLVSCDVSENPSARVIERGIDKYPSGMFYIGNDFYVDKRNPKCIDYSVVVKEWAAKQKIKLGATHLMEDSKFENMSVRLGYPYLYQHQGNCEHLICFSDVRILHESDPLQSSAYPLITCYFRRNVPHCMCCTNSNSVARWLTTGNSRLPHDPFYFCEDCFLSFNYIDGKKVGEFRAYPFVTCDIDLPEPEADSDVEIEEQ